MMLLGEFLFVSIFLNIRCVSPLPSDFVVTSLLIWVTLVVSIGRLVGLMLCLPVMCASLLDYYPCVVLGVILKVIAVLISLRMLVPMRDLTLKLLTF